ncbi:MAG: TRAP transporter small permease [Oscillospiraceae bacterium]|nr:TRAP transporter small permease [Oscillospiraceae bacterium]
MNEPNSRFLRFVNQLVKYFCIVMLAAMTVIVWIQVFARSIPAIVAPNWTEELSRYIMIYVAFVGASNGIFQWNNVGVDMIISRLPKLGRFILNLIIRVLVLAFWCLVIYLGWKNFPKVGGRQFSATMHFPMLYVQISLVIGGILSALQCIGQIVCYAKGGPDNA